MRTSSHHLRQLTAKVTEKNEISCSNFKFNRRSSGACTYGPSCTDRAFHNIQPEAVAADNSPKNSRVNSTQGVSAFIVSTMDGMPLITQSINAGRSVAAHNKAPIREAHNKGRRGFRKASRQAFKLTLPYSNIHRTGSGSLYWTSTKRKNTRASAQYFIRAMVAGLQGYKVARLHGYKVARLQGCG